MAIELLVVNLGISTGNKNEPDDNTPVIIGVVVIGLIIILIIIAVISCYLKHRHNNKSDRK